MNQEALKEDIHTGIRRMPQEEMLEKVMQRFSFRGTT